MFPWLGKADLQTSVSKYFCRLSDVQAVLKMHQAYCTDSGWQTVGENLNIYASDYNFKDSPFALNEWRPHTHVRAMPQTVVKLGACSHNCLQIQW